MLNFEMLAYFARTLICMNDTHELAPHSQANNDPTPAMIVSISFATLYIDPLMILLYSSPYYRMKIIKELVEFYETFRYIVKFKIFFDVMDL